MKPWHAFVPATALAAASIQSAFAQSESVCEFSTLETPQWVVGGSGGDVTIDQSGAFPEPLIATIKFSKEPTEEPCDFHSPGVHHSWARITLPAIPVDWPSGRYEIRVEYDLNTYDFWDPGAPTDSDVFYFAEGTETFSNNFSSMSVVQCGETGFLPGDPFLRWWGGHEVACEQPFPSPCVGVIQDTIDFSNAKAHTQHILQVGLNTGFLYFSWGEFKITIVPQTVEIADPKNDDAEKDINTALIANGAIVNDPIAWADEGTLRNAVAADDSARVVLRRWAIG